MAIAFDAYNRIANGTGNSYSQSVTVTGSNTIGFVGVFNQTNSNTVTSITWNGVAMTLLNTVTITGNNTNALYYIINPTTGNVAVTFSESNFHRVDVASYTGAAQTSPIDADSTFSGSGTSLTSTLTSTDAGDWMVVFGQSDTANISAGTGLTRRSSANDTAYLDSNGVTGTGSVSGTFTVSSGNNRSNAALFKPVASATFKTWNGVALADIKTINGVA